MDLAQLTADVDGNRTRFELATGQTATLGRSSKCTFRVRDRSVSRVHCELQLVGGRVLIQDLGSTQGILQRGRTYERLELDVGDDCEIGNCTIRFSLLSTDVAPDDLPTRRSVPDGAEPAPAPPGLPPGPVPRPEAARPEPLRSQAERPEPVRIARRPAPPAKVFAARLAAESIVFTITASIVVALLLLLKIAVGFDLYAAFGWLPGIRGR